MISATSTTSVAMAAGAAWAATFGLVVVAVLIGAFWWGSKRAARKPVPPQEPQARSGSWHEPDPVETHHTRSPGAEDPRT